MLIKGSLLKVINSDVVEYTYKLSLHYCVTWPRRPRHPGSISKVYQTLESHTAWNSKSAYGCVSDVGLAGAV